MKDVYDQIAENESLLEAAHVADTILNKKMICLRMPLHIIHVLKEIAHRKGIGYQALLKHYVDEGIKSDKLAFSSLGRKPKNKRVDCGL